MYKHKTMKYLSYLILALLNLYGMCGMVLWFGLSHVTRFGIFFLFMFGALIFGINAIRFAKLSVKYYGTRVAKNHK